MALPTSHPKHEAALTGAFNRLSHSRASPAMVVPGTPVQWLSGVSGNWNTAVDWTGDAVPTASSDVTLAASGTYTVKVDTAVTAQSVLIDAAGATLEDTAGGALSVGTTLKVMAGRLSLSTGASVTSGTLLVGTAGELLATGGTISASVTSSGLIHISSGTLVLEDGGTLAGKLNGAGTLALTNGTYGLGSKPISGPGNLAVYGGGTLSIAALKDLTLAGGLTFGAPGQSLSAGTVSGFGTLTTNGDTSINADGAVAQMVLGNGITWINNGTVSDAGLIDLNLAARDTVALINQAGANFDLTGDSAAILANQAGTDSFTNAGTLAKTGGIGTSLLNVGVSSTGLIEVVSGTLEVISLSGSGSLILDAGATFLIDDGGTTTIGISGARGTLAVGGGTFTATAAQLSEVGALSILAGTLAIDTTGTLSGLDAILGSGTLSIESDADISIGGPLALGTSGSTLSLINGTMTTSGATTAQALFFGPGFAWVNDGALQLDGTVTGDYPATITNETGASISLNDETVGCLINNAGTLSVAGGTMTELLNSTGTIDVNGSFDCNTLTGSGVLSMSTGSTLTVAGFDFNGIVEGSNLSLTVTAYLTTTAVVFSHFNTFTLAPNVSMTFDGESGTVARPISLHGNSVTIDAGTDISFSNAFSVTQGGTIAASTLNGPGTLTTLGATTLTGGGGGTGRGLILGNGIVWVNASTVQDSSRISMNLSASDSVTIINEASATFDLTSDLASFVGILHESGTDTFVNDGTLSMLTSSNNVMQMTVINDGVINVDAGNLNISNFAGAGSISVAAGATLSSNSGTFVGSNSIAGTLTFGYVDLPAGTMTANSGARIGTTGSTELNIGSTANFLSTGDVTVSFFEVFNAGQIEASAATLTIDGSVSNTGRLLATNNAILDLSGTNLNLINGTLTGGTYRANTNSIIELANNTTITTDSANITLGGPDAEIQSLDTATNAQVTLQSTLATITASATLSVAYGAAFTATADAGTFTNQGTLILLQADFTSTELDIASTGTLSGYATIGGTVVNAGAITASKGALAFLGNVINTGNISAASESLSITGAVSGTGTLELTAGGTLVLLNGVAATQAVDFLATTGVLDIAQALQFNGQIGGFAAGDQIDLLKTAANGLSYANNVLTVTENQTTVASLNLTGDYSTGSFTLTTDGHNGNVISFI